MFALVGLVPSDFLAPPASTSDPSIRLPSLSSWFAPDTSFHGRRPYESATAARTPLNASDADGALSDISSEDEDEDRDDDDPTKAASPARVEKFIREHEHAWQDRTHEADERFLNLSCVAVALAMSDTVMA